MGFINAATETNGKGNVSESKVMTAYIAAGFTVLLPFGNGAPYDLVVDLGHRMLKVQVKTGRLRDGCVLFPVQRISGHRGKRRKRYGESEFHIFAVYCPDNDKLYVQSLAESLSSGRLRCDETKNRQKEKVRWARHFEFEYHIAQLREEKEEFLKRQWS